MGTMIKTKEPVQVIAAKIPKALYSDCEGLRDLLGVGTLNEVVRLALIVFRAAIINGSKMLVNKKLDSQHTKTSFTRHRATNGHQDDRDYLDIFVHSGNMTPIIGGAS